MKENILNMGNYQFFLFYKRQDLTDPIYFSKNEYGIVFSVP